MLKFIHGTMDSAKSANLLIKAYQLERGGRRVLLMKSVRDTRDLGVIRSRVGLSRACELFTKEANLTTLIPALLNEYAEHWKNEGQEGKIAILIDECQFCTPSQIQNLRILLYEYHIDIFCYGLKTTYKNTPFDAASYLLAVSDITEEIIAPCVHCGADASTHLRYEFGVPVFIGGNEVVGDVYTDDALVEYYESVCQDCWGKVFLKNFRKED